MCVGGGGDKLPIFILTNIPANPVVDEAGIEQQCLSEVFWSISKSGRFANKSVLA